jgi:tetratricopeptide (TPR) repeat protein
MTDLTQQLADLQSRIEALPRTVASALLTELEAEARRLLAAARNTPLEAQARTLFDLLAQHVAAETASAPQAPPADDSAVRGLLRRARIRIELAGDEDDIDDAVDILADALDRDPDHAETIALLAQAAASSGALRMKVMELFRRYGIRQALPPAEHAAMPARPEPDAVMPPVVEPPAPAVTRPEPPRPREAARVEAVPADPGVDLPALAAQMTQVYYAGDYKQTVDLANRILERQAEHATALEYRQKAEENILRGVVPDHRIPFDARVAYNRANSLARAGNYDEAERLYREARDIAQAAGIPSWKDAEQALLAIQDLALSREMLSDGDRLMSNDDWQEAIHKYEGALRVVASDPLAQERLDKARQVLHQAERAQAQLAGLSGTLNERAEELQQIINGLTVLRQNLPAARASQR